MNNIFKLGIPNKQIIHTNTHMEKHLRILNCNDSILWKFKNKNTILIQTYNSKNVLDSYFQTKVCRLTRQ